MSNPEIIQKINTVVADVLGCGVSGLSRETTAESIEGWDSLSHIQIVVALEKEFEIRFSAAELIDYQNIGALADGIERKLAASGS